MGADVTSRISGGGITKVVASKATYAISPGHHRLENARTGVYPPGGANNFTPSLPLAVEIAHEHGSAPLSFPLFDCH